LLHIGVLYTYRPKVFSAGCDDYISKPIDLGVLQKTLEEFIRTFNEDLERRIACK